MKTLWSVLVVFLAGAAALAASRPGPGVPTPVRGIAGTPLPGPTTAPATGTAEAVVVSCAALTPAALDGYRTLIGRALSAARADAQANGSTGAYAVAATNARNVIQRAHDRATEMVDWNQTGGDRNPQVTIYSEGDQFKAYLRTILETLPQAAHWASISAVYHKSQRARDAFDGVIASIDRGNRLMGDAGRCFMSAYFP